MPTRTKALDNITKHLTREEITARQDAEERVMPSRMPAKPPRYIKSGSRERKIWDRILKSMAGYDILDVLDADTLGVYCSKQARWEELAQEREGIRDALVQLREGSASYRADPAYTAALKSLAVVSSELRDLENGLLTYATKLGLTPDGRARLARKLAEQQDQGPDDDLFA